MTDIDVRGWARIAVVDGELRDDGCGEARRDEALDGGALVRAEDEAEIDAPCP